MTRRPFGSPTLLAVVLLLSVGTARAQVSITARPWYDPNYSGTNKRYIDAGTVSFPANIEFQSITTEFGSADVSDVFTSVGASFSYQVPAVSANPSTYDYGTARPTPVPNPMIATWSHHVSSITPPNPPHPTGNRWATKTTVIYRTAASGPMPPGSWQTIHKVGYP